MLVDLHPDARAELRAAALWYEERTAGAGDRLLASVTLVLDRVAIQPESFERWPGAPVRQWAIRKANVPSFPYLIAFEPHDDYILVLAVAHGKRRPLYWLSRAEG